MLLSHLEGVINLDQSDPPPWRLGHICATQKDMRPSFFQNPTDQGAVIRQSDPRFTTKKKLANVRILDPVTHRRNGATDVRRTAGMTTTLGHQAMGRHGKVGNALVGCSVAAPRSTTRRTCSRPAAVGTPWMTTTATVSVLPSVLFLFIGDPECGQRRCLVHPQPQ